jgi:TonB family protein
MRIVLLLSLILPLILPLIKLSPDSSSISKLTIYLNEVEINPTYAANEGPVSGFNAESIVLYLYLSIAVLISIVSIYSLLTIVLKRMKSKRVETSNGSVYIEEGTHSPFTFFNWIFLPDRLLDHPNLDMLLKHEHAHVNLWHSIDTMISQVARVVLWFSPFVYLSHKYLTEVHEFQADEKVILSDSGLNDYSNLLLSFTLIPETNYHLTNPFSYKLKKRIIMINNVKHRKLSLSGIFTGLFMCSFIIGATAMINIQPQNSASDSDIISAVSNDDTIQIQATVITKNAVNENAVKDNSFQKMDDGRIVFNVLDEVPTFPGGIDAMLEYLHSNINYPEKEQKEGIQGTVYVNFVVNKDGSISDIKVLRGIHKTLDENAVKAVSNMPKWNPGKKDGKPEACSFNIPIKYSLDK